MRITLPRAVALAAGALVALACSDSLGAQQAGIVRGRTVSAENGDPLPNVVVAALALDGSVIARVISGATGAFALHVPWLTARIVAARIGFEPDTIDAALSGDATLVVRLRPASLSLDPVVVSGERGFAAASSSAIRELDIHIRPRASAQELLALAPGLIIAQHAGGGKADQIYLRGFDADHGTDIAVSVDGAPINIVSHAHGQGYADLHFLIPEIVERVDVHKGPFEVRDGDFATAGSVALVTRDRVDDRLIGFRLGAFETSEVVSLITFGGDASRTGGYLALARHGTRGPFEVPQNFVRHNAFAKWTAPLAPRLDLVASASAFGATWRQSGQIAERAVQSGVIDRRGSLDPTEGGTTERHDVAIGVRTAGGTDGEWSTQMYATRYRFRLFSNFTFFLADSVNGDGIEQVDDRFVVGAQGRYARNATLFGRV